MDDFTILRLGAVMFAFGSLGLFVVRMNNHRLRGLGWLGAAFVTGFLGTLLMVLHLTPVLSVLVADLCVLGGFALLDTAVVDLMTQRPKAEWTSLGMAVVMIAVDVERLRGVSIPEIRLATVSLLVASQCVLTALTLWRTARPAERTPALFSSTLLGVFAAYNVARSVVALLGYCETSRWARTFVVTDGYVLYIAVALGLAFGFFWMSTAQLSIQLEQIAGTDPLTRLYNRRTFLKACEKEIQVAREKARPFSVLMMDLDHFKNINDVYGHAAGDEALIAAVEAMQNAIRGSDVLARWGGEEFAALLPNATVESAMIVAERMRQNVERLRLVVHANGRDTVLRITASLGAATSAGHDTIQSVMARADRGLYLAKDGGRNRVVSITSQDDPGDRPGVSTAAEPKSAAA